jgi:hypothetical protein
MPDAVAAVARANSGWGCGGQVSPRSMNLDASSGEDGIGGSGKFGVSDVPVVGSQGRSAVEC